jgi:hypothetical protein
VTLSLRIYYSWRSFTIFVQVRNLGHFLGFNGGGGEKREHLFFFCEMKLEREN